MSIVIVDVAFDPIDSSTNIQQLLENADATAITTLDSTS